MTLKPSFLSVDSIPQGADVNLFQFLMKRNDELKKKKVVITSMEVNLNLEVAN